MAHTTPATRAVSKPKDSISGMSLAIWSRYSVSVRSERTLPRMASVRNRRGRISSHMVP